MPMVMKEGQRQGGVMPQRDSILEEEWDEEEREEQEGKEKEAEQQRLQELMRLCMDWRGCKWTMRREQWQCSQMTC